MANEEYSDDMKATAKHDETVAVEADQISPWQCMAQNPKIILWTLYANSTWTSGETWVMRESLTMNSRHGACGIRESRPFGVSGDASVPVSTFLSYVIKSTAVDP